MSKGLNITNKRKRYMLTGAIVVAFFCVFAIILSIYIQQFNQELAVDNEARLAETTSYVSTHMTKAVSDTQDTLQSISTAINKIEGQEKRLEYLHEMEQKLNYSFIGYAGEDGYLRTTVESRNENIKNQNYYQSALKGKSTVGNYQRLIYKDRAASGILVSVPYDANKGVLVAMIEISQLNSVLNLESFGGAGYTYIFDSQGTIIMRNKSLDFNNIFVAWQNVEFEGTTSFSQFKDDVKHSKSGLLHFANTGVKQYAYHSSLPFNDWNVITIVSEDTLFARTNSLSQQLMILSTGMVGTLGIMLLIALRSYGASRDSKEATNAKSAFLANMSHEIRTPMNAIIGISEIMLRDNLTPSQRDHVLTINNSGKGLLTIINDILDVSKIESGKFTIIDDIYELDSLLYDVTNIVAIRMEDKPVNFFIDIDPTLPNRLVGDAGRIKQILLNIVGNAIKFTEEGSITLSLSGQRKNNKYLLKMDVIDTGIGIKEADLQGLFGSFNQVDTRRNRNIEGTGLGLSISQKLAEMMDGSIHVESEYGKGSAFTILITQGMETDRVILPSIKENISLLIWEQEPRIYDFIKMELLKFQLRFEMCSSFMIFEEKTYSGKYTHVITRADIMKLLNVKKIPESTSCLSLLTLTEHTKMDHSKRSIYLPLFTLQLAYAIHGDEDMEYLPKHMQIDASSIQPLPYIRTLIVDDNLVNIKVAKGLMSPYNMRIDEAISGQEAIDAVIKNKYDFVLMDHMMPGMDGVEALQHIRELPDERGKHLLVIALSANATEEAYHLFMEKGFDGFLAKPIEMQKLDAMLRLHLKNINQERANAHIENELEIIPEEKMPILTRIANGKVHFDEGLRLIKSLDIYISVLETYQATMQERFSKFEDWYAHDLKRFQIEVHGLKSSSYSIGAMQLGKIAEQLEELSQKHHLYEISSQLPAFFEEMKQVMEEIDSFLKQQEHHPVGDEILYSPILISEELMEAMQNDDKDRRNKILADCKANCYDPSLFALALAIEKDLIEGQDEHAIEQVQQFHQKISEDKQRHVVIVDDDPVNLMLAKQVLSTQYQLTTLTSGAALLSLLEDNIPDMILLDILMPKMDGYEVIKMLHEHEEWKDIPVIFLTGQKDIQSERDGFALGAKDFITKPFDNVVMMSRIHMQMELHQYQTQLQQIIDKKANEVENLQHVITVSWAEVIESRDGTTGSHVRNTTRYFHALLEATCATSKYKNLFSSEQISILLRSSSLHDIGKIGISDLVLKKQGPLDKEEYSYMKLHARIGADMVQKIIDNTNADQFLIYAREMALHHHERWDGCGYPEGLKGEEIPIFVRILTIVDVFDALTAIRPYKRAFTFEESISIMEEERGKFYCPELFDIFIENEQVFRELLATKNDSPS